MIYLENGGRYDRITDYISSADCSVLVRLSRDRSFAVSSYMVVYQITVCDNTWMLGLDLLCYNPVHSTGWKMFQVCIERPYIIALNLCLLLLPEVRIEKLWK